MPRNLGMWVGEGKSQVTLPAVISFTLLFWEGAQLVLAPFEVGGRSPYM